MKEEQEFHMSYEDFQENGRILLDWIVNYYRNIEKYPVLSGVQPGEIREQLPEQAPRTGESFEHILKDVDHIILRGITHWQSPNFFAFFPANTSGPSILGELLSAGLGVQGMMWATSPACTELETRVLDWLVDMLGLPQKFKSTHKGGGVIQDTASSASLCAVIAAREQTTGFQCNKRGGEANLVAYVSTQTHSSLEKAVKIAGIGKNNLRLIDVDGRYAMKPEALEEQIKIDIKDGKIPFFVCATVGTTSSNAMDPVREIGEICRRYNIWLHVDAAMAGTAAICPEFRYIHRGLELADSYCFNPHKWMFTNFDCDCFYVSDRKVLTDSLSILPEYLRNKASESGEVIDYRDWHIPMGRRFRALKLWFVIRHYGIEGLQYHIRYHVKLAQQFAKWIENHSSFELSAPVPLNLVCFRHKGGDRINQLLLERLNQEGKVYLVHTRLQDRYTIRMCIGQTNTKMQHVESAWNKIQDVAAELEAELK